MSGDEVVKVGALHINLPPELAEGNSAFITVLLELTATDAQLFANLLGGQVVVHVAAADT